MAELGSSWVRLPLKSALFPLSWAFSFPPSLPPFLPSLHFPLLSIKISLSQSCASLLPLSPGSLSSHPSPPGLPPPPSWVTFNSLHYLLQTSGIWGLPHFLYSNQRIDFVYLQCNLHVSSFLKNISSKWNVLPRWSLISDIKPLCWLGKTIVIVILTNTTF